MIWLPASVGCTSNRTATELSSPNRCTPEECTPWAASAARSRGKSAGSGVRASITMPPAKSMPRLRPG